MIKCYFVDVKNISSTLPQSNFDRSDLNRLADLILASDGLLRPLVLTESGTEQYTVIEGHREYYAALIAKEKDPRRAEMVNAFVINQKMQQSAIDQLKLLNQDLSAVNHPVPTAVDPAQLLTLIQSTVSHQIQPLIDQLTEQKQLLIALTASRISPPDVTDLAKTIEQPNLPQPSVISPVPTAVTGGTPKPPQPATAKSVKAPGKTKQVAAPIASINSNQAANSLNLINTLSQAQLLIGMERSSISKAVTKLVPSIIASRGLQPSQRFDSWETISALKISGLGAARIKEIIEKLK